MWLKKLLTKIDETSVGDWVENKRRVISDTDLNRIDVENVRSFFGLTTDLARGLCNLAVRDGVLEKFIAIECPNSLCRRTLTTVSLDESLDDEYSCVNCEFAGREPYIFDSEDVKTRAFYRLVRNVKKMPNITRGKLDIYRYLSMIILKFISGIVCLFLLVFITVCFIYSPSIAAGIAEVTLGGTTFVMYRYFFDTRKAFLKCPDCGYEGEVITDPLPSS